MRELSVKIRFTKHCLGHVRRAYWTNGHNRAHFLMPRDHEGRVVFMPSWWTSILVKAAEVLCRHQDTVRDIHFAMRVAGEPGAVPAQLYRRYYAEKRFALHEAYYPGDTVELTCVVPASIDDASVCELLRIAGQYFGISPSHAYEFGYFTVESVAAVSCAAS